jgi:plastocyanin
VRTYFVPIAVVSVLALPTGSALAANQTVTAGGGPNLFDPAAVTVTQGDTVTWNNAGGFHNVHFEDGSFDQPPSPSSALWSVSRPFTTTGSFRYYCEAHGSAGGVGMSGTVTVKPPYQAPQSASPLNVSLVPVFKPCGSGGNGSHSPPLAVGSCGPPVTLAVAHVGSQGTGSAQLSVTPGNPNTAADEADVALTASSTDVRDGSATGPDYGPNPRGPDMTLVTRFRITDLSNGTSQTDPATAAEIDFSVPVDCATTTGSGGSNCTASTTADAVMPGVIKEGRSMVIQVFRVRLNDSGPDNTRNNADDTLFEQQGIFEP